MNTPARCLLHLRRLTPASRRQRGTADGGDLIAADPELLLNWSPAWEVGTDGLYLDLTGTGRLLGWGHDSPARVCREAGQLWGDLAGGAAPTRLAAALASSLAAAWAARGAWRPGCLLAVPAGSVTAFLAPFAITALAASYPAEVSTLRRFGLCTLGDLQTVSSSLLVATLGPIGAQLAEVALGHDRRPLQGHWPAERIVVSARLPRPLTGRHLESALRRAVAVRALLACRGGPGAWRRWRLRVCWGDAREQTATAPGEGPATFRAWLQQIEKLWQRLGKRRRGLTALQLAAGAARRKPAVQGCIFAAERSEQEREQELATVWQRLRQDSPRTLYLASEDLLTRWGIHWEDLAGLSRR